MGQNIESLVQKIQETHNPKDIETLIEELQPFLHKMARKYNYTFDGMDFSDLLQEGTIGLLKAIDKWDVKRGVPFKNYASWWVMDAITRAISHNSRTIKLPANIAKSLSSFRRFKDREMQGLEEKNEEYSVKMEGYQTISVTLSIDTVNETYDEPISEMLESQERSVNEIVIKDQVEHLLNKLPVRDRHVVRMRFGLGGKPPRTLEEVGEVLGISYERVRQIETEAIRALSKANIDIKEV